MAYSPEQVSGLRGQMLGTRNPQPEVRPPTPDSGLQTPRLVLLWLLLLAPLSATFFRLGVWLGAGLGSSLCWLAFAGVAGFAALALGSAFSVQRSASSAQRRSPTLPLGAAALPLVFSLLGAAVAWSSVAGAQEAVGLFVIAGATAFSNAFCWLCSHYLAREIGAQAAASPAVRAGRLPARLARYLPPLYPALTSFIFVSLFLFAFALGYAARPETRPQGERWLAYAPVAFVFGLFALLVFNRFQHLLAWAQRDHLALPGGPGEEGHYLLKWAGLVALGTLLLGLLAAALPLQSLVRLGEIFRLPPPSYAVQPQSSPTNPTGMNPLVWLLGLLLLAIAGLILWLLARWLGRTRAWQRIVEGAARAWKRLSAWLAKLFPRRKESPAGESLKEAQPEEDRFVDIFQQPELLARLSPRQIILSTFHLLLEYALLRGWLRRTGRPPLEILRALSAQAGLEASDLACLTWAYSQAAYSQVPISPEKLAEVKSAWSRLKPRLLETEESSESTLDPQLPTVN